MHIRFIGAEGVEDHDADALDDLLARPDGFVWVDIPEWHDSAEQVLNRLRIGVHPMALTTFKQRNHLPTIHAYPDHVFLVLHSPYSRQRGRVHLIELDQLVATRVLVTIHGPINPVVPLEAATEECDEVLRRMAMGRFAPTSPAELSYAIVSTMVRRHRTTIGDIAERIPDLEKRVMKGDLRNPEELLEEMFLYRHELITVRTMAAQAYEIYARMSTLDQAIPVSDLPYAKDLAQQFKRIRAIADGEGHFLANVIDLYQTRVTTKMTLAMERLAVIAAVTLPVTAIASVYGMNVIVNSHTHVVQLTIVLIVMLAVSGLLLRWTHKQGWW